MSNGDKIILDLCGGTGAWSKPYKDAGYDVRLVTLPEWDARLFPSRPSVSPRTPKGFTDITNYPEVYGILAAPVCTCFSGSGACWPRTDTDILNALSIVDACLRIVWALKPNFWAMENPVGKLRKWIGESVMSFNPCDYGDPYKKRTLLWGDFNINLKRNPVLPIIPSPLHQNYGGKSVRTKEARSITPPRFAKAFFEANR
jgi:site-specific DNA-cytosine methylase